MKRLSIIVPVYNVEKYLGKCLDSLLDQDIPTDEYEIIIINDGSTDGSITIVESYINQNSNIKYFSQENKGPGAARNVGIRQAEGKSLIFVDSDDYILPNTLGIILTYFETKNLEILRFNYEAVNEAGIIIPKKKNATNDTVFSEQIVDGKSFLSNYLGWSCYVWLYIIDANLIKNNCLFFNEEIYFEDVEWLIRVLTETKRICSINTHVYNYLHRINSITNSTLLEMKNKIITDKLFIINMLKFLSQKEKNNKIRQWCEGMISLTFMGILQFVENELPERKNEIIKLLYNKKLLPLKSYCFTLKQKRDLFIINLSPGLYCYLRRK